VQPFSDSFDPRQAKVQPSASAHHLHHTNQTHLCNVEEQEGHHEGEQTGSFGEGETENGILEELTTEGWVAGNTLDETTEYSTDTNTGTSETDGSNTSALDLSGSNHGSSGGLGDDAAGLDRIADHVAGEGVAGAEEAVLWRLVASSCS
jgi:hypothetical protein